MVKRVIVAGTVALAGMVMARPPNYDEARVARTRWRITFADGRKLASAAEWPARRREILDIFAREMYGQPPPPPEVVKTELIGGRDLAGLGIRRQYKMVP